MNYDDEKQSLNGRSPLFVIHYGWSPLFLPRWRIEKTREVGDLAHEALVPKFPSAYGSPALPGTQLDLDAFAQTTDGSRQYAKQHARRRTVGTLRLNAD